MRHCIYLSGLFLRRMATVGRDKCKKRKKEAISNYCFCWSQTGAVKLIEGRWYGDMVMR